MSVKLVYSPIMLAFYVSGDDMRVLLEAGAVSAVVEVSGAVFAGATGTLELSEGAIELLTGVQDAYDEPIKASRERRKQEKQEAPSNPLKKRGRT